MIPTDPWDVEHWEGATDRGARILYVVPGIVYVGLLVSEVIPNLGRVDLLGQLSLLLICLAQFGVIATVWWVAESALTATTMMGATVAGLIGFTVSLLQHGSQPNSWWPGIAVSFVSCFVLAWAPPRAALGIGLPGIAMMLGLRAFLAARWGIIATEVVVESVSVLQLIGLVTLAYAGLRRAGTIAAEASRNEALAAAVEARATAERAQAKEVERLLHDEVIHALRAIAMPRRVVGAGLARRYAVQAVSRLDPNTHEDTETGLLATLQRVADQSGLEVSLRGEAPDPPPEVGEGFAAATREALNNVARHSGANAATILVAQGPGATHVQIRDHGRGFDTEHAPTRGIRRSIVERMHDVGGTAAIESGPHGTAVNLTWAPDPLAHDHGERFWEDTRRDTARAAVPILVGVVITATVLSPEIQRAWLGWVGTVLVGGAGLGMVAYLWRRPLPGWAVWLLPLIAGLAVVANVYALSPTTDSAYHYWLAAGVVPLLLPVVTLRPPRISLPTVVAVNATIVVAAIVRFGPSWAGSHFMGAFTSAALLYGAVVCRAWLSGLGGRIAEAAEAAKASEGRTHHLRARNAMMSQRLTRVEQRVGSFLRAAVAGELDLAETSVRQRASLLEAMVRDEIHFGGGSADLARTLAELRELGWQIEVVLERTQAVRQEPQIRELLDGLRVRVAGESRIRITALPTLTAVVTTGDQDLWPHLDRWAKRAPVVAELGEGYARLTRGSAVSCETRTAAGDTHV